jgi:LSD1 subclass zinc finger protein
MDRAGAKSAPIGCEACHTQEAWTDLREFDHAKTEFPLLGAHRAVDCKSCHVAAAGAALVLFKGASENCADCHKDVHAGQFAKNGKTPCSDCHNADAWSPSTFDHNTRTSLPLTGGHANVRCQVCHKQSQMVDAREVIIYHLAPKECSDCHATPK